jgi:hypothetical protein
MCHFTRSMTLIGPSGERSSTSSSAKGSKALDPESFVSRPQAGRGRVAAAAHAPSPLTRVKNGHNLRDEWPWEMAARSVGFVAAVADSRSAGHHTGEGVRSE